MLEEGTELNHLGRTQCLDQWRHLGGSEVVKAVDHLVTGLADRKQGGAAIPGNGVTGDQTELLEPADGLAGSCRADTETPGNVTDAQVTVSGDEPQGAQLTATQLTTDGLAEKPGLEPFDDGGTENVTVPQEKPKVNPTDCRLGFR
jgi:hypothetical protein